MKIFFYLALLTVSYLAISNEKTEEELKSIYSLMKIEPDSAINVALDLKSRSEETDDYFGIVKTNFTIGYILDNKMGDYGKAIIYYLEAIRYAKDYKYDKQYKDLASLHKNCGVIFRKFKSYSLAEEYYKEAAIYAEAANDDKQIKSISFNTAGLLMDQNRFSEAITILNQLVNNSSTNSKDYWKYSNRLGIALFEHEDYKSAIEAHNSSLKYAKISDKLYAYTIHNIGSCYSMLNDFENAYTYYQQALEIKEQLTDKSVLFSTYNELGILEKKRGDIENSLTYFNKAEAYIDKVAKLNNYELYKSKADVLFHLQRFEEAKKYQDMYSKHLNDYLEKQTDIQETDKRYNMDLITKRYEDQVKKEEQIANILFISKAVSGSLLTLLLLTVGYNRYQQVRLRKSITQELINLKVID